MRICSNVIARWLIATGILIAVTAPSIDVRADEKLEALEEQTFREAAAVAGPSIVRIQTVGGLDRVGQILTGTGPTTGVVVSAEGYVVSSAFNFISKPSSILVQLVDGRRLPATLVATDRSRMLTLLKVDANDLVPLRPADSQSVRVGQWAIALGRTYEAEQPSISVGIVSALNRVWGKALQTDAKISPVNYGGPLVDINGQSLGILVPLAQGENDETSGVEWYDSGIGFAIPMQDVLASVERLKSGKDLFPGLLGVTLKQGTLDAPAAIDRVRPRSPAAEAGLQAGDVIVEVEGKPIRRHSEVQQALGRKYADDTVVVVVKRGDERLERSIKLVAELTAYESGYLGILPTRPAASETANPGVGIRHVFTGSPAAKAGLLPGDRILKVGDTDVADVAALRERVSRLRPKDKTAIVYSRYGTQGTAEVTLDSIPNEVESDLPSSPTIPGDGGDAKQLQTGRFTVDMANQGHSYWAYVPEDYNPVYQYSVMIWIHPAGDTMEAAIFNEWKTVCDLRGILIVAPKSEKVSGWELNEGEFVRDAFDEFCKNYSVDRNRVLIHSYATSGAFAYHLAYRFRDRVRGVAIAGSPFPAVPPENDPDQPLQFYLVCGDQDPVYEAVEQSVAMLRARKYPAVLSTLKGADDSYPAPAKVEEIGRWADSLDRI